MWEGGNNITFYPVSNLEGLVVLELLGDHDVPDFLVVQVAP